MFAERADSPGPCGLPRARAAGRGQPLLCGLLVAVAVAGVSVSPATAGAQPGADPCAQAGPPGDALVTLTSGGLQRTALVHLPPAAAGQRLPVLVALHGAGQNGRFFAGYSGFSVLADAEGFIAVYPYAMPLEGITFWTINDHHPGAPDDVQFISDLLDHVEGAECVDAARVYATGVSNGGGMAALLGCALSQRLAAIAPVAGGYGSQPPCQPTNPLSVLEVHGTSDGTVPYAGVSGLGAVRPYVGAWARRDGCSPAPRVRRPAARVLRYAWTRCAAGTTVEHLEILGGGHQLPGGMPPDRGPVSTVSAPWLIWSFLRSHRQAPPFALPLPSATPTAPAAASGSAGGLGSAGAAGQSRRPPGTTGPARRARTPVARGSRRR